MAETIATGYVQILPSAKGMKEALAKELKGSVAGPVAAESKTASDALSKNIATAVERDAAPRVQQALTKATGKASLGFASQMKVAIDHFGGGAAVLQGLAQQGAQASTRLRGLVQGSAELGSASGALKAGLMGVTGLLGGPWGVAIAGAGLAINGFVQSQQNAADAVKAVNDTLDQQTGKLTKASLQTIAQSIIKDLDRPGDLQALKGIGVTVGEATAALAQGSDATTAYVAHLQDLVRAEDGNTQASRTRLAALRGLISSIQNQSEVLADNSTLWGQNKATQDAATDAARQAGVATDAVAAAVRAQAAAARDSAVAQTIFQQGMDSIAGAAANVQTRIDAIPSNVRISASAVGLDSIRAQADAAFAAMTRLLTLSNSANRIQGGGERHGADVSSSSNTAVGQAARQVSQALAAADAAYNRALAAIRSHNAGIKGAKTRGGGSKSDPIAAAREALAAQVTDTSFISDLLAADSKAIGKLGASLIKGAAAALTGGRETALTALIRKDTAALQSLATRRAAVAKNLADAQSNLASLQSAKASATSSLTQAALGDLTGARSASGVQRVLTRQLQKATTFRANLAILAKRGLPGVFLQQLINAGLDGAYTAAALVRANDNDFAAIQSLTTQLNTQATGLGTDAGAVLYDSGIAAAQGLIKGLQSQESAVEAQMLRIAKAMQAAIKKALGIRSPSQVFAQLGRQIPRGMAVGVRKEAPELNRTVATMVSTRIPQGRVVGATPAMAGHGPINVYGVQDPATTARLVSDELVWRNRR